MSEFIPVALHTAPSGKVTKWGIEGTDETFKSKVDAMKRIAQLESEATPAPAPAEAPEAPEAPKVKKGKKVTEAPKGFTPEDIVPEGATLVLSPSGAYARVMVGGKSTGYVTERQRGTLVAEVLTSRLGAASKADFKGTKPRQNQTALLVKDDKAADQARRLFAIAAATVEVAK